MDATELLATATRRIRHQPRESVGEPSAQVGRQGLVDATRDLDAVNLSDVANDEFLFGRVRVLRSESRHHQPADSTIDRAQRLDSLLGGHGGDEARVSLRLRW
jgi:hypothetical protein